MAGKRTILMVCLISLWASCGYRFSGPDRLPGGAGSVAVEIFENRTAEVGVEHIFTNDLIHEFHRNGGRLADPALADAILTGVIDAVKTETVSYRGQITSLERRVTAWITMRLTDQKGRTLWKADGLSDSEVFGVLSEKVATDYNKQEALRVLSGRMAEKAYHRMTDSF